MSAVSLQFKDQVFWQIRDGMAVGNTSSGFLTEEALVPVVFKAVSQTDDLFCYLYITSWILLNIYY